MVYIVSLAWGSECYHTHWVKKFNNKEEAQKLYTDTLKDQAKRVVWSDNWKEEYKKEAESQVESFNDDNGTDFKLLKEEEIDNLTNSELEEYIELSLMYAEEYDDSNEWFDIEFLE